MLLRTLRVLLVCGGLAALIASTPLPVLAQTPGDDPTGKTILRTYRNSTSRFPVGGIRSPHDGIIKIQPDEFVAGCRSAVSVATP